MVKAIIFDFDGVIHNTFELYYGINKKINPTVTREEYKDFFNGNIYENKKATGPAPIDKFFELQGKEFEYLIIEEEIRVELLKLKKKYKLFIVTSNQESTLKKYFFKNNLQDLFDEILGVETHKSKVEKFKKLFKEHNLKSEECIFVTDTLGDILEAKKLDIKTVAVDYGFHEAKRLLKGKPYKIISHIREIDKIL